MTINDYNKIQINYNIKRNADNQVIERSTMVNIRCDSTEEGIKLYKELKSMLNGELTPHVDSGNSSSSIPSSSNSANLFPPNDNICPRCGGALRERRSKTGSTFLGCSNYPSCRFVKDI